MAEHAFKPVLIDLLGQAQQDQENFIARLDAAERAAVGTPDHWTAKDHVAHMAFWRRCVVEKLAAILAHETPPSFEPFEAYNRRIYSERRDWPWSRVQEVSQEAYTDLVASIERLSDEDLVSSGRFDLIPDGESLYDVVLGNSYEHTRDHLAQYLLDRGDLSHATELYERWTERVVMTAAPDHIKGIVLYNLACFYATHGQVQKAAGTLPEALRLAPQLEEWSRSDPDLAALRPQPVAPFYSGWEGYQQRMVQALAPLSSEQLTWSAVPHLRSVGLIARHVVGARARWLRHVLGEGGEELETLGTWDDDDQPQRSAAELVEGFGRTWDVIAAALARWRVPDLEVSFPNTDPDPGDPEAFSRQWVIWHLIEHDLHHGGEISLVLGMNGLAGIEM
jgi:uncharacterized damage-inducible protein DinB